MSLQAIVWAIEEADVESKYLPVLLSLANHADRHGREAYPSVSTISWESRKSRAQVKKDLKTMRDQGLIRYNTELTLAHLPADRRPAVYDLVLTHRRDMRDTPLERPASGWPSEHPARREDRGIPHEPPPTEHEVNTETAPGARPRAGAHPEHDRGLIQSTTGGSPTSPKPSIERATHTPAPAREATDTAEPETATGVCVTEDDKTNIIAALRANLIDRAPASKQKDIERGPKDAIVELAVQCRLAGATVDEIDTVLSGAIDGKTEYPYTHGSKALSALLERKRGAEDPLGTPGSNTAAAGSSWVDDDGVEWPHHDPYARPCRGLSCTDYQGQRYVAVEERRQGPGSITDVPVGDAFSCPVCRKVYKPEEDAAA